MSFIGDYFNHERAVQRRIDQLEALNEAIIERKEEAGQVVFYLNELKQRIQEILTLYPDLAEEDALKEYFMLVSQQIENLNKDIETKRR